MSVSSSAVIIVILFFCIADASASVISKGKTVDYENLKEFKVYIMEEATKYAEKVSVDKENDLEYFHVPAHNELTEADYLYDFRSNISVRREKSMASCYLGPLPEDLQKLSDLRTKLQMETEASSEGHINIPKYWVVSEEVDKTILRQEVQDFCDQFPVFRLQELDLSSLAAGVSGNVGRTRFARRIELTNLSLCDRYALPSRKCHPHTWLFSFQISDCYGVWWVRDCKFSTEKLAIMCEQWQDFFLKNAVCYKIRCP